MLRPIIYNENGRGQDIFSQNLENRIIHLVGPIEDEMAATVVAQLLSLDAQGHDDIYLYINSPGGSVTAGLGIYDTMKYIKCDVSTICVGMAASMGSILLCSGAKGKRMILPRSLVMIHQISSGAHGRLSDMEIDLQLTRNLEKQLYTILSTRTGQSYDQIKQDAMADHWFNAQEAIDYGLCDKIVESKKNINI